MTFHFMQRKVKALTKMVCILTSFPTLEPMSYSVTKILAFLLFLSSVRCIPNSP